jgi:hypothetical protein
MLAAAVACSGCTAQHDGGPCWPIAASHVGGQVTIGTGDVAFQAFGSVLPIVTGQGLPLVEVQSRISGIPPGDPDNPFAPGNPKTLVTGTVDTGYTIGAACPATLGYRASPAGPGLYDITGAIKVPVGDAQTTAQQAGHSIHLVLEVIGSDGAYAKDQHDVTLGPFPLVDAGVDAM